MKKRMETQREIEILNSEQLNDFYDPSTASNGGGYDQPKYVFRFGGTIGEFADLSCGEFGSRYSVDFGGKSAYFGSMLKPSEEYSDFGGEDEDFLIAFYSAFGVEIPTAQEIEGETHEEYTPWTPYGTLKTVDVPAEPSELDDDIVEFEE